MKPQELQKLLKSKTPPTVLDVRSGMEYRMGHVPGALLLPFWKVIFRLTGSLPKDKQTQLVLYCESGARAEMVGSMLAKRGYSRIAYLDGDMPGWRQAKLPIEK
jgi:rhodanese-related sulfurtransferase